MMACKETKEIKNHIVEEDGKFRLLSHTGKNLGTFDTRAEAEKHEREVEYFKEKANAVYDALLETLAIKHGVTVDDIRTQFNIGQKVEHEHTENDEVAAKIALDHIAEDAEYYSKLVEMEKQNSVTQKPTFYYARHMQPGTCGYEKEIVLVDTDAMKKMVKTGCGIPVYIHHQTNVEAEDVKEKAVGYVTESFYNELDGYAWFKIMCIDDEARLCIANGWKVSNAYRPSQWGVSGTKNNVHYDREIVDAEFTHLAIVPNPRYEDADIFTLEEFKIYQDNLKQKLTELHNSKDSKSPKGLAMFKLFRKDTKEVSSVNEATHVEIDGKQIPVEEMVNAMKKNECGDGPKKEEEKENETVDVQGEKMTVKELINRYTAMNEKKNAEDEEKAKKEKEEKEVAEKKNAEEEEKKKEAEEKAKKEEAEKTNGLGFFNELCNANQYRAEEVVTIETGINMTQRGKERYGS